MSKDNKCNKLHIEQWQIDQLHRVGSLIRGDWSGSSFDGRAVRDWIDEILSGNNIDEKLKEYEDSY